MKKKTYKFKVWFGKTFKIITASSEFNAKRIFSRITGIHTNAILCKICTV